LPTIEDDVVLMFITARREESGQKVERSAFKKLSPALQASKFNALTRVAAGYAAYLLTLLKQGGLPERGFVDHNRIAVEQVLNSVFLSPASSQK
jgi:hypothetical protein